MKRIIGAALAGLAALTFAVPAEAAPKQSGIEGILLGSNESETRVFVGGKVFSQSSRCVDRRKVTLIAEVGDGDARKKLGTDLASRNGGFFIDGRVPEGLSDLIVLVDRDKVSKKLTCGAAADSVLD